MKLWPRQAVSASDWLLQSGYGAGGTVGGGKNRNLGTFKRKLPVGKAWSLVLTADFE